MQSSTSAAATRRWNFSAFLPILLAVVGLMGCDQSDRTALPQIDSPAEGVLDPGELGIIYTVELAANEAPATWTVLAGALPPGLTLEATTGVLTGTPTQLGSFVFTVRATNDAGSTDAEFTLVIARSADALAPHISTDSLPDGAATVPYEATLLTGGTPPITFSIGTGSLPAGLALGEFTGVLAGTPTTAGVSTLTVVATNDFGSDSQELSLTIAEAPETPSITAPGQMNGSIAELPDATVGSPYDQTFTASGTAPILWTVGQGTLPAGLSLNVANGNLSGTPTRTGTAAFTVVASNAFGSAKQECSLTVAASLSLSEVTPETAPIGATVVLTGTGFDAATPGNNAVKFDDADACVLASTATTLHVEVPAGVSGQLSVTVTLGPDTSAGRPFEASTTTVAFVDADATSGNDDGSSWRNAYLDPNSAFAAGGVDQVWIAEGTYLPGTVPGSTFAIDDVEVYGGFAGDEGTIADRDLVAHVSVFDGDLNADDAGSFDHRSDNAGHVVTIGGTVVLDGIAIRGGEGANDTTTTHGGGLHAGGGTLTLRNTTFRANRSPRGGGAYTTGVTLVIEDSLFVDCHANGGPGWGGGLYVQSSPSTDIRRSVFSACTADLTGGASMSTNASDVICWEDCLIVDCASDDGAGGIMANEFVSLTGCTFYGNRATSTGGGAVLYKGGEVFNCMFRGNTAGSAGSQLRSGPIDELSEIDHCNIEGGESGISVLFGAWNYGAHNIDADPNFADAGDLDGADDRFGTADDGLVLVAPSTSIDAGTAASSTLDLRKATRSQGAAPDIGAYETTPVH